MTSRPIILILGPTAGGKTALSVALAAALPGGGECIGADSMQVYTGMDIGTAKPTVGERAGVPHHLFDIADPAADGFSVDTWLDAATAAVADIRARGRWPIVVGGTNLYVQALLYGLFDGPPADEALRQELQAQDGETLRARLVEIDPSAAERIHPNDRRRTIRAIEVHAATGRPISEQQAEWSAETIRPDVFIVGLEWPVEMINGRINARVRAMVEDGLVEEVRRLEAAGSLGAQAREALGYKQVLDALEGRCTLEEAVEQIKIRTRRFAKQQRTWLRRFRRHKPALWMQADQDSAETICSQVVTALANQA
ncbi:MAG: tRNA (adenosine(37)-N6)-dimethylallyltransferase MiaA [Planctomycetota bacterium]|jgi:tRNA dimethylallyltransferase